MSTLIVIVIRLEGILKWSQFFKLLWTKGKFGWEIICFKKYLYSWECGLNLLVQSSIRVTIICQQLITFPLSAKHIFLPLLKAHYVWYLWKATYTYAYTSLLEAGRRPADNYLCKGPRSPSFPLSLPQTLALTLSLSVCLWQIWSKYQQTSKLFLAARLFSLPKDMKQRERGWMKSPQQMWFKSILQYTYVPFSYLKVSEVTEGTKPKRAQRGLLPLAWWNNCF